MNWLKLFLWLQEVISRWAEKQVFAPPVFPPEVDEKQRKSEPLQDMLLAIKKHEGWYPGSRSYRNNNPGNIRGGQWKLAVGKDSSGFCVFKTYADGYITLQTLVLNAARGKSTVYKPTDTLRTFFRRYAPPDDNNNAYHYAEVVATAMGVDPDNWQIRELV